MLPGFVPSGFVDAGRLRERIEGLIAEYPAGGSGWYEQDNKLARHVLRRALSLVDELSGEARPDK